MSPGKISIEIRRYIIMKKIIFKKMQNIFILFCFIFLGEIELVSAEKASSALNENDMRTWDDVLAGGKIFIDEGRYDDAINYYKTYADIYPNIPDIQYALGFSYFKKNDYDKAKEYFQKTVDLDFYFAEAYFYIAVIYYSRNDYNKSLEYLNKVSDVDKTFEVAYYNKGIIYLNTGEYRKAVKEFAYALYLNPDDLAVFNGLSQAYSAMSKNVTDKKDGNKPVVSVENNIADKALARREEPKASSKAGQKGVKIKSEIFIIKAGDDKKEIIGENGIYEIKMDDVKNSEIEVCLSGLENVQGKYIKFIIKGSPEGSGISAKVIGESSVTTPRFSIGKLASDWRNFYIEKDIIFKNMEFSKIKRIKLKVNPVTSDKIVAGILYISGIEITEIKS